MLMICECNVYLEMIQAGSLLKESSSTIRDIYEVLSDKDWEKYKQKTADFC